MAYAPIASITFTRDSSQDIGASQTYTKEYELGDVVYVRITADGYKPYEETIVMNQDITKDIVLEEV